MNWRTTGGDLSACRAAMIPGLRGCTFNLRCSVCVLPAEGCTACQHPLLGWAWLWVCAALGVCSDLAEGVICRSPPEHPECVWCPGSAQPKCVWAAWNGPTPHSEPLECTYPMETEKHQKIFFFKEIDACKTH